MTSAPRSGQRSNRLQRWTSDTFRPGTTNIPEHNGNSVGFLRKQRGVPFVRRAPTEGGDDVPIHVAKMTAPHVLWWHSHVQPIIDRDPSRADNGWNWLLYVPFAEVAGRVLTRKPAGYTIGISDRERDRFIPCALVQLLGRVPALDDHDRESVFVWFLSTAPHEALTTIEDHERGRCAHRPDLRHARAQGFVELASRRLSPLGARGITATSTFETAIVIGLQGRLDDAPGWV